MREVVTVWNTGCLNMRCMPRPINPGSGYNNLGLAKDPSICTAMGFEFDDRTGGKVVHIDTLIHFRRPRLIVLLHNLNHARNCPFHFA